MSVTIVDDILSRIQGAWRHRKVGMIAAWAVAVIGWGVIFVLPDSYEASASVFVNTSTALRPLLEGLAVDQDVDSQLNLVRESLLGRPRLEKVAREADLDLHAKTPADKERVIVALQHEITIEAHAPRSTHDGASKGTDSVYTLSYRNSSRDKAYTVVRSLLNSLVEDTMSGKREGADTAQKFLVEQIATYEKRLSAAEAELADFKKRNVGLVPGEQGDYFARLQNEVQAVQKARSAVEVAQRRRSELERQLRGEQPFSSGGVSPMLAGRPAGAASSGGSDTASRIAETQARLDDLLLRFTDKHPDVIALQETLAQLKARQKAELEAIRRGDLSAAASSGLSTNPVYQTIQVQINQVDVELASLRGDLADHEHNEAELRRVANTAPEVEAEYARLTRDYNVEKAQYTALVERLQKAKLSDDAAGTGVVQFQVINPPTADYRPKAPNRPLLVSLVFLASLAAGIALSVLASELRPIFSTPRSLADATNLVVLGAVSRVCEERVAQDATRSMYRFIGSIAGLGVLFVAVLLFSAFGSRALHQMAGA